MKKIALFLCAVLMLGIAAGCSSSKEEVVESSYKDDKGYTINRRGETVKMGDWEITYKNSGASDATKNPAVMINIKVKNNGKAASPFTKYMDLKGTSVQTTIMDKDHKKVTDYKAVKIIGGQSYDITDKSIESGAEQEGRLYFSSPEISTKEFNEKGYILEIKQGKNAVYFLIEQTKTK